MGEVLTSVPKGCDVIYGKAWPKGRGLLPLELQCYREGKTEKTGGLGPYKHFANAWKIVWPKYEWNEWTALMVHAWCNYSRISIMGHAAAGKTYTLAHIALLDWLAEPFQTMTSLATVTAEGLRLRMWADLMRAHESMAPEFRGSMKVYSTPNRMNIMLNGEGNDLEKFIIEGMSVSRTKDAMGRIRGKHAPRRRVIFDEADDMPGAAYDAMGNIMTDPDVKIVDMSNAVDRYSQFGKACEPRDGWSSIHDTDLMWEGRAAGKLKTIVLHLDGLQNPNMKRHETEKKFPYMLGGPEIQSIRERYKEESKEWWAMVRGFFPPDGIVAKIFTNQAIERSKKVLEFDFQPKPCATLDPAFEQDDCVLHRGEWGKLRDGRDAINAVESVKIHTKEGAQYEPKDYQIAHEVMRLCKEWGVQPLEFIMDKSGNGRGVFAILQREWSTDVQGINYGGEASDRPIRMGDSDKANEVVRYFVSELWFRMRYLCEDGCVGGLSRLDEKTIDDLNVRRYERKQFTLGQLMVAESKDELKKRLGRSPDYGDAFCQFGELLARNLSQTVKATEQAKVPERWNQQRERAKKVNRKWSDAIEVETW